jgi:hypothetical protein
MGKYNRCVAFRHITKLERSAAAELASKIKWTIAECSTWLGGRFLIRQS